MNITKEQVNLWSKIESFDLENYDAAYSFVSRLERENGWKLEYTLRVIFEYKRFIFLQCISSDSLTPSDQIDQVWHLHLIYTHNYWIEFCQNTLQKQIHHGPTKGGKSESQKFYNNYENTLSKYKIIFQEEPPKDIWPSSEIRFNRINFQRINMDTNWIFKKPKILMK